MMMLYLAALPDGEDRNTFAEFYRTYRGVMYQASMKILGKRQLAEDAVHDAFLAILEQTARLGEMGEGQKLGFAVLVARNKAVDILRREREGRTDHLEDLEEDALLVEPEFDDMGRVFGRLPERYAYLLRLLGLGLKPGDIARLTGQEAGAVYKQIARGKKLLGEALEKEGYEWHAK